MQWVVVTGLGAVTPLAAGVEASWSRHLPGRSGIQTLPNEVGLEVILHNPGAQESTGQHCRLSISAFPIRPMTEWIW